MQRKVKGDNMRIERVEKAKYDSTIRGYNENIYNESSFNKLNEKKVDDIYYLVAYDGQSPRFALCIGVNDNNAKMPYSAPNALPVLIKKRSGLRRYEEMLTALEEFAVSEEWKSFQVTLPPLIYNPEEISAWINALFCHGYTVANIDMNYSLDLAKVYCSAYMDMLPANARRNLHIALRSELELNRCVCETELSEAYDIILANRQSKGYPLRMTKDQVMQTIKIVNYDMYIVRKSGQGIAAALLYSINDQVEQLIYWGDLPGIKDEKPINYLAYQLIQIYGGKGFRYLDIGIATEDSIPNYGLCDFKESIGCERSIKYSFIKEY